MQESSPPRKPLIALVCVVLLALGLWALRPGRSVGPVTDEPFQARPEVEKIREKAAADQRVAERVRAVRRSSSHDQILAEAPRYVPGEVWGDIDLREVHEVMPDSLYWVYGAPTTDPEIQEAREEAKEYWNTEYGKVLSGFATEEEILAYYAYREQISADYIDFADYMLERYGDSLPENMQSLLNLSLNMHSARLDELPKQLEEALARREEKERARQEWQRSKEQHAEQAPDE